MLRETDHTYPNPPDDMPKGPFMLPWTRKPLSGKPKPNAPLRQPKPSKSGIHSLLKRKTYDSPFM